MDLCFYHEVDFDGKMSAAIVRYFRPNVELIGFNYDKPIPWDLLSGNKSVVFVDVVTQPYSFMVDICEKLRAKGGHLTVIDHHKSWIESEAYSELNKKMACTLYCKESKAACELVWEYFSGLYDQAYSIPQIVSLLGQYDSWRLGTDPFDWDDHVLPFQYGLRLINPSISDLVFYLNQANSLTGGKFVVETTHMGKIVLQYQKSQNEIIAKNVFEKEIRGFKCLCLNSNQKNSMAFASVWDKEKYDYMIAFSLDKERKWKFSIYTDRDDCDASQIARYFGGGGHRKAAGWVMKFEHFTSRFCPISETNGCECPCDVLRST